MKGFRWTYAIAATLVVVPTMLWLAAAVVHVQWCSEWCLKCTHPCTVAGLNADWLMTFGLILSPYALFLTIPLALLAVFAVFILSRRRRHAALP